MISDEKEDIGDLVLRVAQVVAECDSWGYRGFMEDNYIEAAKRIIALVKSDLEKRKPPRQ